MLPLAQAAPSPRTRRGVRGPRRPASALALALVAGLLWPALADALTIEWDPNTDGITAGYYVTVGLAPGTPLAIIDVGLATRVALPLPAASRYYVAVGGYAADRRAGPLSLEVEIDLVSPPGRPEGLAASVSGSTVGLWWSPPGTGGAPLTYLLYAGTAPGAADLVDGLPLGSVTTVTGTLPPGRYYARLRAANLVGAGPASGEVMFQVNPAQPPGVPSSLRVTWTGRRARLTWSPPDGAAPTGYVLEAGTAPGSADLGVINVGGARSFDADVPAGTFYVRVRAVNAVGQSAPSNELVLR